jgi:cell division protein FtsB
VELTKQRRNPAIWHHLNRFLTVLIVVAGVLFIGLTLYPEWKHRNRLATKLEEEQAKFRAEQLLQKKREREVNLLQTDPGYVETIARDKLGVMKEGETIFRLDGSRAPVVETTPPPRTKTK